MLNGVSQRPVEGFSLVYTFNNPKAKSVHRTQYFEMFANRAIYNDGWIAATTPPIPPWVLSRKMPPVEDYKQMGTLQRGPGLQRGQRHSAQEPGKLRELQDLFWAEAGSHHVLPLDNSKGERFDVSIRPNLYARARTEFTYRPGAARIPEGSAPDFKNKSFTITAVVEMPANGAEGVLMTQGGRFGDRTLTPSPWPSLPAGFQEGTFTHSAGRSAARLVAATGRAFRRPTRGPGYRSQPRPGRRRAAGLSVADALSDQPAYQRPLPASLHALRRQG